MSPDPTRPPIPAKSEATPGRQAQSSKWLDLAQMREDRQALNAKVAELEVRLAFPERAYVAYPGAGNALELAKYYDYVIDQKERRRARVSLAKARRALDRLYRLRAHHRMRVHGIEYRDWKLGGVKRTRTLLDEHQVLAPLFQQYALPGRRIPTRQEMAVAQVMWGIKMMGAL